MQFAGQDNQGHGTMHRGSGLPVASCHARTGCLFTPTGKFTRNYQALLLKNLMYSTPNIPTAAVVP
eukprot:scaffold28177_cov15-Tisochrysis_lutea.AAC.1